MEKSLIRHFRLANELSQLFDLESNIDNVLAVSMYKLNQLMDSERSSIFLFDPLKQQLTSFSSQDLEKKEIRIPKSSGVSGWVFEHRMPAIVNDTDNDSRFYSGVDDMTGFRTRNLICTPLIDYKERCSGTLQSLNKKSGDFTTDDLELLDLTARLVAVAISNSRRYDEILTTNMARKKLINKIVSNIGNLPEKK
ncbi:MAG: GAF domain-containing protein [Desulfobacterales bacterium]